MTFENMKVKTLLLTFLIISTFNCCGGDKVKFENAWIAEPISGSDVTGGYITITNKTQKDDVLKNISSDISEFSEMHKMSFEGDIMRMEQMEKVELPVGKSVLFEPGGMHIMLINLKKQLHEGDIVPITFHFEKSAEKRIEFAVKIRQE